MPVEPLSLPEVTEALNELWQSAGSPSGREIATTSGCSHTTAILALNGGRTPQLRTLLAIVRTLGGNEENFRTLYNNARPDRPRPPTQNELLTDILDELRMIGETLKTYGPNVRLR